MPPLVSEDLEALFVRLATLELAVERLVISLLLQLSTRLVPSRDCEITTASNNPSVHQLHARPAVGLRPPAAQGNPMLRLSLFRNAACVLPICATGNPTVHTHQMLHLSSLQRDLWEEHVRLEQQENLSLSEGLPFWQYHRKVSFRQKPHV